MKRVRLAVIGVGYLGRIHARLARDFPGWQLCGVVDPQPQARQAAQAELGVPTFSNVSELPGAVEAAIVATPSATHYAVASQLLSRGVHLLVEKPLTLSVADAQDLIRQAEQTQRILHVGHVERFNPAFAVLRPHLPRPSFVLAQRVGTFTGRSLDVGVVLDLMIHDLDAVLCLMGDDAVATIQASGAAVVGPNEDWAQVQLTFAGGSVAHLFASRVGWRARRVMELFSPQQLAEIDFGSRKAWLGYPKEPLESTPPGQSSLPFSLAPSIASQSAGKGLEFEELPVPQANPLLEEQRQFHLAITEGTGEGVTGQEAVRAIDLAERILAILAAQRLRYQDLRPQDQSANDCGGVDPFVPLGGSALRGPHWGRPAVRRKAG